MSTDVTHLDEDDQVPENEPIGEKIDRVSRQLTKVRIAYERENKKRDRRIRLNQILIALVSVIAVLGIAVGVGGIRAQDDANRDTFSARVNSCVQYNRQQTAQALAEKSEIRTLVDAIAPKPRTAEAAERVRAFLPVYDRTVESGHPSRDCSRAGIEAFLGQSAKP